MPKLHMQLTAPVYIAVFSWLTKALSLGITMEGSAGRKIAFPIYSFFHPQALVIIFFYFPTKMKLLRFTSKASWGRFWDSTLFISCACQHFEWLCWHKAQGSSHCKCKPGTSAISDRPVPVSHLQAAESWHKPPVVSFLFPTKSQILKIPSNDTQRRYC